MKGKWIASAGLCIMTIGLSVAISVGLAGVRSSAVGESQSASLTQVAATFVQSSPTATSTLRPSVAPEPTATDSPTPTSTPSATDTLVPTATPTSTSTHTPSPSATPTSTATATPTLSHAEIVQRASMSVVRLEVPDDSGWIVGTASGSIICPQGWILTNWHVVENEYTGELVNKNGLVHVQMMRDPDQPPERLYTAKLRLWDRDLDLAILKITSDALGRSLSSPLNLPAIPLGDSEPAALAIGSPITIIGFPGIGHDTVTITEGSVAGRSLHDSTPWLKTAAKMAHGNSGGMAVNERGELVGIPTMNTWNRNHNLGYLRPIASALSLIRDLACRPGGVHSGSGLERMLRIVYRGAGGVNLRGKPSLQSEIKAVLHADQTLHVIVPGNYGAWWAVYDGKGAYGWVREFEVNGNRLAQTEKWYFDTKFETGQTAQVMCISMDQGRGCLNMRRTPGYLNQPGTDVIKALHGGSLVEIIGGPQIEDGLVWHQIREASSGAAGWIAETTAGGSRTLYDLP